MSCMGDAFLSNWGDWTEYATSWYDQAALDDLMHIAHLRIPQSFVDGPPRLLQPALRERVAYHQYHLLLSFAAVSDVPSGRFTNVLAVY